MGTGRINRALITPLNISPRNKLLAVASRTFERAQAYAAEKGIEAAHGSYEALLADPEIDAVYISLPNNLHAEWSIKAAAAGKHVLCEKPLALSVEDVDRIEAAAHRYGVVIAEAFMYRHHPQTLRVVELIHEGAIGRLQLIRGGFTFMIERPEDIRLQPELGGGSIWDVGCYPISYARTAAGGIAPEEVFGWQETSPSGVDTAFFGQMRFPGGVVAQVDCGFNSEFRTVMDFIGDRGRITVTNAFKPSPEGQVYISKGDGIGERLHFAGPGALSRRGRGPVRRGRLRQAAARPLERLPPEHCDDPRTPRLGRAGRAREAGVERCGGLMPKYLLGIDVSTTGAKALVIDSGGNVVASATEEYPLYTPKPLWSEQNPEDWWQGAVRAVQRALHMPGVGAEEIAGIGLTGQMHGMVLLDDAGQVLRPAILWNDQRTGPQCEEITAWAGGLKRTVELIGNAVLPGFTAPKIVWVRENEPATFERVAQVLLPKDYIRYRLTGEYASEVSDASGTALFDVGNRRWSATMAGLLQVPMGWLPHVDESPVVTGRVSESAARADRARGRHAGGRRRRRPGRGRGRQRHRPAGHRLGRQRHERRRLRPLGRIRARARGPPPHVLPRGAGRMACDGRGAFRRRRVPLAARHDRGRREGRRVGKRPRSVRPADGAGRQPCHRGARASSSCPT